ncbi:MAG: hypothetical protein RLN96_09490 [Pseudomonadales bacterium]
MYIPRPLLIFLIVTYMLFLLSVDWINASAGTWYRPFLIGLIIILVAGWIHRDQESDEL